MDEVVKIPMLMLEESTSGGNESYSYDSITDNNTTILNVAVGTKEKKNLTRDETIDYKTRTKRHTERDNEKIIEDQAQSEADQLLDAFCLKKSSEKSLGKPKIDGKKNLQPESHLLEELRNCRREFLANISRSSTSAEPPRKESPKFTPKRANVSTSDKAVSASSEKDISDLKKQNYHLMEVLVKTQKNHEAEKKRFHEILLGLDKALSSLPIRLERIRVRNQKNLSIINSSRFNSGDVSVNIPVVSGSETTISNDTVSSQESNYYLSIRMKCLLRKMNQLNELIHNIQRGDSSSPIELLVNSELYAISLLKNEIKSTKKQIDETKTDTETMASCDVSTKEDFTEDSASKGKNSFSKALNNASNFKIFENHMILQEEALNLLTRKIKETEEALLKEIEMNEDLRRENETMSKEILRLKTAEKEAKEEGKDLITGKSKTAGEDRPYRLIKELKAKLDEKEKIIISWKSKYSRLECASSNRSSLLENEKKKNSTLELTIKNLRTQNKNLTTHMNSLEFVNEQLKSQCEIYKSQVEVLAKERLENHLELANKNSKIGAQIAELNDRLQYQESKVKKAEKEAQQKIEEMKSVFETEMLGIKFKLTAAESKNEEFCVTFKELLRILHKFWLKKKGWPTKNPNYNKIREILQITPSDLEVLFSVYGNSSKKEVDELYAEFRSIVDGKVKRFSAILSSWFFDIITEKLLPQYSNQRTNTEDT